MPPPVRMHPGAQRFRVVKKFVAQPREATRNRFRAPRAARCRREPTTGRARDGTVDRVDMDGLVMILPQVHLRKPCYDFCFL